jgi:hypothetical protein
MNIKGLTPSFVSLDPRVRTDAKEDVRMKNSGERDADGRRQNPEPEQKRHLSEEELESAIAILKANAGVVAHSLVVRVEAQGDHRVVYIEDLTGKVIRRLSEAELWTVTREKDRTTGKILDKAG